MPFKIALLSAGADPSDWSTLDALGLPDPDWTYQPYAETVSLGNGDSFGRGFAIVRWRLAIIKNAQRSTLRGFCPGASADVYISTPTNEDDANEDPIFKNFLAKMSWIKGEEDKQITSTLDVEFVFTHLVEQIIEE
jgi:hypothetical protein